jgi:hypothetical protein
MLPLNVEVGPGRVAGVDGCARHMCAETMYDREEIAARINR